MPSVRWRRLDLPGTDRATLTTTDRGYLLLGHAQYRDPQGEADLHYSIQISPTWRTERALLHGAGPQGLVSFDIVVQPTELWSINALPMPAVTGATDVDLNITPATNLLSIRRLQLSPGQTGEVTAAWLSFPEPELKPLRQIYTCLGDGRYAYQCPELSFQTTLQCNPDGLVTAYPPLWAPD